MTEDSVRIEPLAEQRAQEAGDLLAASHADYPSFRWLFPASESRHKVLQAFMRATALDAARAGRPLVALSDGAVAGVALWMPPGTMPLSFGRKLRMTPALLRVLLAAPRSFLKFAALGNALEKAQDEPDSWYLQAMGVHPGQQRRGIGGRLMQPVLHEADREGRRCSLHTSDEAIVAYYERFGFQVSQPAFEVLAGGPSYIGMAREPRQPAG